MGMFVLRVAMLISIASVTALGAHAAHAQSGPIFDPAPEEVYALGSDSAKDIALADVDGDGDLDALIANGDIFSAYDHVLGINDGQGNFSLRAAALGAGMGQAIAVADLDGDDDPDIVIAHANSSLPSDAVVWINQGGAQAGEPGAFIAGASLQTHQVTSLLLGDVDSDGDRDVVVNAKNEDLAIGGQQIWLNNGLGQFTAGAVIAESPIIAYDALFVDVNGDQLGDLIFAGESDFHPTRVMLQNGAAGTFTVGAELLTPGVNNGLAAGDLDGDGHLDIYVASSGPDLVWWGDGAGNFTKGAEIGTGNDSDAALADLDGDGDLDVYAARRAPGRAPNVIWINQGDRTFLRSADELATSGSYRVALGDLDGDGDIDAFTAEGGVNRIWWNTFSGPRDVHLQLRTDYLPQQPRGAHYAALYARFRDEIIALGEQNPALDAQFNQSALQFAEMITLLLAGDSIVHAAQNALITEEQIDGLEMLLDILQEEGSPQLVTAIQQERTAIGDADRFVGMSVFDAAHQLLEPQSIFVPLIVAGGTQ